MQSITVVVSQADQTTAQRLADRLRAHFHRVVLSGAEGLPAALESYRASLAILDLNVISLEAVQELSHRFQEVAIVCTHHAPDAEVYLACVQAGAADCCHASDITSIVRAYRSVPALYHRHAVAA
jgi:DNA-binding NarL/FixJ family response regulator